MEKTVTMNLRVNPNLKQQAEDVLKQLGVPMATAVDIYLHQIILTGGIPFSVSLPKVPTAFEAGAMVTEQLRQKGRDGAAGSDVKTIKQKQASVEKILRMRDESPFPADFDLEKVREEAVREKYGRFM